MPTHEISILAPELNVPQARLADTVRCRTFAHSASLRVDFERLHGVGVTSQIRPVIFCVCLKRVCAASLTPCRQVPQGVHSTSWPTIRHT